MHSVWLRFIVKTIVTFRGAMLVLEGRIPPPVQQSVVGREKAVLTLHRAPLSTPSPATSPPACSRDLPEYGDFVSLSRTSPRCLKCCTCWPTIVSYGQHAGTRHHARLQGPRIFRPNSQAVLKPRYSPPPSIDGNWLTLGI
jgi:hypothetical protein